ncbi:hypothetical protein L21SP2_2388 [Salinispira pacifica]|uniref:Uncharacterized protein n=1 Tax=Salinispira pacifica TaxID=1307761 RepID=V5WKM1_9SPIO|nr:hypothetical protein L21SP2_2388 [Salinispira pacifica]
MTSLGVASFAAGSKEHQDRENEQGKHSPGIRAQIQSPEAGVGKRR